ncbi:transcriptional regulator, LacI family [Ruaniaceae bacterium KH17]|nr:transcriptional regulator, LacI family [Ruaniaceae bacterium KH17]
MASRKEVAAAAGVSVRTVSNVVNGFQHVAPETRERVLEAIERLSYRPSELARSLKTGRSGLVGLMLPELDVPYFAELVRVFVEHGVKYGMTVVIDQTDGDRERELSWIGRARNGSLFDALILSPLGLLDEDLKLIPPDLPVMFLGEHAYPGFDQVAVDGVAASRDAVTHLIETGRTQIAAIGAEADNRGTSAQRLEGYTKALGDAGLPFDERRVGWVERFSRFEGYQSMTRILESGTAIDAAFCFTDTIALGALRALNDFGLRVPEDVALVGFDDIDDGRYAVPSLSTVHPDKVSIATTAFTRLMRRLGGEKLGPEFTTAPYELVIRESSAR